MASASVGSKGSSQEYGTPPEFLRAVERRFGKIGFDLAANKKNHVVDSWFGPGSDEAEDALKVDWRPYLRELRRVIQIPWLNPPFSDIEPFAEKLQFYRNERIFMPMLAPASIGTRWYEKHARDYCITIGLTACRLKFIGATDTYPKDLALYVYGYGLHGFMTWDPLERHREEKKAARKALKA